jgi:hypothetical protein
LYEQLLGVNWSLEDTALAIFANGVAMLANVQKVRGVSDDFVALRAVEKIVREHVPSFSVKDRKSL